MANSAEAITPSPCVRVCVCMSPALTVVVNGLRHHGRQLHALACGLREGCLEAEPHGVQVKLLLPHLGLRNWGGRGKGWGWVRGPACSCERAHQHLLLKGLLPVCSLQVMASFTSFFFTHWIPRFGKLGGERGLELGLAQTNDGKTSSAAASIPVDPPLLQLGLVVSVFTVFPNQLVGVGLVGGVLGYQGDADTQRTTVVVHLRRRHVLLKRPLC